jgi:Leucine-rich repeat (LRR) protein
VKNKLTFLPDLSDFQNLEVLNCEKNQLTSLPSLPQNLKRIRCSFNKLTSLPDLTCFKHLEELHCYNNNLTLLPGLPQNIERLHCYNNNLTSLPCLSHNLKILLCFNNHIYKIVDSHSLFQIKQNVQIVNNFRYLYYCLKLKEQLRKWLWEKVREPKIKMTYHPNYLINLKADDDLDTFLDNWK